jgi:hypothetical protein
VTSFRSSDSTANSFFLNSARNLEMTCCRVPATVVALPMTCRSTRRLTGTGASAARWYWETGRAGARTAGQAPPPVKVPVGFTAFPGEIFPAPRSWVEVAYPGLAYASVSGSTPSSNGTRAGGVMESWQ